MPFKNAIPFLRESIGSIINQDYTDWELVAVNDHSSDNSENIAQSFAINDPRVRVIANSGKGIIAALQTGLEHSNGTFISRMDADDIMPAGRLKKMVTALVDSDEKTVVTGLVKYFSKDQVTQGYINYERWLNDVQLQNTHCSNIYRECVVASPNWIMRRHELLALGGFGDLSYPEDYDLVFKWYLSQFKFKVIPEITLLWREHLQRTSRNSPHYKQKAFFKLKLQRFVEKELQANDELLLWGTGRKGKISAKILTGLKVPFRWIDLKPETHNYEIYGHEIEGFDKALKLKGKKILLAVYPAPKQRLKIIDFLTKQGLTEGEHFWFL